MAGTGFFYTVKVTIKRNSLYEPRGVTEVVVTREVQATSWGEAVNMATATVLDDLSQLFGSRVGTRIVSAEVVTVT